MNTSWSDEEMNSGRAGDYVSEVERQNIAKHGHRQPLQTLDLCFYAIRQRSTGFFLPHHFTEGLGPFTADESKVGAFPRPFKSRAAAQISLNAWLKGRWKREHNYDGEIIGPPNIIQKRPHRDPSDMEIVEIRLGSIRPV